MRPSAAKHHRLRGMASGELGRPLAGPRTSTAWGPPGRAPATAWRGPSPLILTVGPPGPTPAPALRGPEPGRLCLCWIVRVPRPGGGRFFRRGPGPRGARAGVGPGGLPPDPRLGAGRRAAAGARPGGPHAVLVRGEPAAGRAGRGRRRARAVRVSGGRSRRGRCGPRLRRSSRTCSPSRRVSRWLTMLPATAPLISGPSVVRLRPARRISRFRRARLAEEPRENDHSDDDSGSMPRRSDHATT